MKRTRYLLRCWLAGIALGAVVGALFAACDWVVVAAHHEPADMAGVDGASPGVPPLHNEAPDGEIAGGDGG